MRALCDRCHIRPPVTALEGRPLCRVCVTTYRMVVQDFQRQPIVRHCTCPLCTALRAEVGLRHVPYRMAPLLLKALRDDRKTQARMLEREDGQR